LARQSAGAYDRDRRLHDRRRRGIHRARRLLPRLLHGRRPRLRGNLHRSAPQRGAGAHGALRGYRGIERADQTLGENRMNALHVATLSGWRRFESDGGAWRDAGRGLMYWSLTCLSVDPENPAVVYAGSEHSGLFYSTDGGKRWLRANPNVPKLMLFSLLALPGTVMAGTVPGALYRKTGGGWEELEGVPLPRIGPTFPPSTERQEGTG